MFHPPIADVAVAIWNEVRQSNLKCSIGNAPSSKISNLLCRTIARAKVMICLCPMDKLPPPFDIALSRVSLPSSVALCSENKPAARRASFNTTSSYCAKGSTFSRRVPVSNSGYQLLISFLNIIIVIGRKRTTWGITVIWERSASRLIVSVAKPS